ncbi:protein gar2-like [Capsicum annuum]|uniref:protein gar2-like n=1 Tax=Capsicum annuum TaxID=4072 RepID=UPI001FB18CE3|nr:protein gar2-like [Capsicum annuum]
MDSGDASIPRRKTRQQFLKFCVNFIEKRNRSCQNGNPTGSSTCSVNIKEDVSRGRKRKMVEESTDFGSDKTIMRILEDGSMVRNRDKGQKKSGQWERDDDILKQPFIKEISDDDDNSEEEVNDSDVVAIGEAAAGSAVNTGSGSWSNLRSQRSLLLPIASSESKSKASSSESEYEASSSESESKASSDEDSDDPNDKKYRIHKSSSSKKSAYRRCDFDNEESKDGDKSKDDDLSCPIEQDINEEGKKESNGWEIVPYLAVEGMSLRESVCIFVEQFQLSIASVHEVVQPSAATSVQKCTLVHETVAPVRSNQ